METPKQDSIHVNVEKPKYENGVIFDEDTGQHLGILADNLHDEENTTLIPIKTIPATLSVFLDGYWYIYKLDSREQAEDGILRTEIKEEVKTVAGEVDKYKDL
jgi:hypothetical protein